jgi:hypothetical protein
MNAAAVADEATHESRFRREVERLMDEQGIADLEDLYGRFMAQEPERIGNARWTFERFMPHVNHDVDTLYPKFIVPLCEALAASDVEQAGLWRAWFDDIWSRAREA